MDDDLYQMIEEFIDDCDDMRGLIIAALAARDIPALKSRAEQGMMQIAAQMERRLDEMDAEREDSHVN